jgi:hypothetical protein
VATHTNDLSTAQPVCSASDITARYSTWTSPVLILRKLGTGRMTIQNGRFAP